MLLLWRNRHVVAKLKSKVRERILRSVLRASFHSFPKNMRNMQEHEQQSFLSFFFFLYHYKRTIKAIKHSPLRTEPLLKISAMTVDGYIKERLLSGYIQVPLLRDGGTISRMRSRATPSRRISVAYTSCCTGVTGHLPFAGKERERLKYVPIN